MCWSGPWGRHWKQSLNCIYVYVFYTNLFLWAKKRNLSNLFAQKITQMCSRWLIWILFWVPVAPSLLENSTATGWFLSTTQSPREAMGRGNKALAGGHWSLWSLWSCQAIELAKRAQSPRFCRGAESESSATGCQCSFRAAAFSLSLNGSYF